MSPQQSLIDRQYDEWDRDIREGRSAVAREGILKLLKSPSTIPKNNLAVLSALCRRTGLHNETIHLLNPQVRPVDHPTKPTASGEEIAEYSAALVKIGATTEALSLLRSLDPEKNPLVYLFKSFAHFSRWQYQEAIPELHRYIEHPQNSEYQKLIGKLNLAAALVVVGDAKAASEQLAQIFIEAGKNHYQLLLGNAYEIQAQLCVEFGDLAKASETLNKASALMNSATGRDPFFVRKWKFFQELQAQKHDPKALEPRRQELKNEASALRNYESLRQIDYNWALATRNEDLFREILFGTPFESYREKIRRVIGSQVDSARSYDWSLLNGENPKRIDFSLTAGEAYQSLDVKPGKLLHRLLLSLSKDFYVPRRVAELFSDLHSDSFYHPTYSPAAIFQLITRMRNLLAKQNLPLEIAWNDSILRLHATAPVTICIPNLPKHLDPAGEESQTTTLLRLDSYREKWKHRHPERNEFSIGEIAETAGVSKGTVLRYLTDGVQNGIVQKSGNSVKTRYRWAA